MSKEQGSTCCGDLSMKKKGMGRSFIKELGRKEGRRFEIPRRHGVNPVET